VNDGLDQLGGFRRGDRVTWLDGGRRCEGHIDYLFDLDDCTVAWVNVGPASDLPGAECIEVVELSELKLAPNDAQAKKATTSMVKEVRG
jgi:hypothetical protein